MLKKLILVVTGLSLTIMFLGINLMACSSGGKSCTNDTECAADEYCANDGKCHKKEIPDGSDGTSGDGDQGPGDTADQGPQPCQHDSDCPVDKVCNIATGDCEDGDACQYSYNCPSDQYCEPVGKICKDRSELCEACTVDEQCPDPGMGDMCITYPDGDFCGQRCGTAGCPPGYDCDMTAGSGTGPNPGQCRSNTGSCEGTFICSDDSDCAANRICNLSTGKCVKKCQDIGCAGGLICHFTGHCGIQCASAADCSTYGDNLVCCVGVGDPVSYCTADSTGMCRPSGCVLHEECVLNPPVDHSYGYCDIGSGECKTGCRIAGEIGIVSDCTSGYYCECSAGEVSCDTFDCCPDPGKPEACKCNPESEDCSLVNVCDNGTCTKIPCYERGTDIACAAHNMCCGFPIDDGYDCPVTTLEGDCYVAPKEEWCQSCSEAGNACQTPGLGYGEPGICLTDNDDNSYCHPACRDTNDCPATWQCNYAYGQGCEQADQCEPTATCEMIYKGYDENQEVQEVKGCHCLTDDDCPDDINGFKAVCVDPTICDHTVEPVDCQQGKICKFGKACLSSVGCPDLISGG